MIEDASKKKHTCGSPSTPVKGRSVQIEDDHPYQEANDNFFKNNHYQRQSSVTSRKKSSQKNHEKTNFDNKVNSSKKKSKLSNGCKFSKVENLEQLIQSSLNSLEVKKAVT